MSKKLCSRGAHSSDNSINNQYIKPKRIQDKKALVTGREETVAGREKLEGLSATDICKSLGLSLQEPGWSRLQVER